MQAFLYFVNYKSRWHTDKSHAFWPIIIFFPSEIDQSMQMVGRVAWIYISCDQKLILLYVVRNKQGQKVHFLYIDIYNLDFKWGKKRGARVIL